mmetsp:Transcript_64594/g.180569  ORF Transcript_64594/g.180569 Transcript_64594/m.180569 type:complete len:234 (-) Transcript_64594:17-718(-)
MDGKLISFMFRISLTISCNRELNCEDRTRRPPIFSGRMSRSTASRKAAIESSKLGVPMRGMLKNRLSENDWSTSCRFSCRPLSACSDFKAFSSVSESYRSVFLLTTKTSLCSGSLEPVSSLINDRAAKQAPRFCSAASEKHPPATKTTSVPITVPKTLTIVLMAAMALLPPSQSKRSMCICSFAACAASFSNPGVPPSSFAMGKTTQSMPSVTGSAESLETKASSRPSSLDAR